MEVRISISMKEFIQLRNTDRIKTVIHKLKHGIPVSFVLLGGSITSGFQVRPEQRFITLFENRLREMYPGCRLSVHNMAVSGTPSIFGLYQCIQYADHYQPDLVFIEYAINDTKNSSHQSAFESMVSRCLSMNKNPGIILLLAKSKVGYTCENYMDLIGEHYHQTSVRISHMIDHTPWESYSDDYGHPNAHGHQLISDLLTAMWQMAEQAPVVSEPIPRESFYNNRLNGLTFLNKRWNYAGDKEEVSLSVTLPCRFLYLLHFVTTDDNYGCAEVSIDGTPYTVLSGYQIDGWEHLVGTILDLGTEVRDHTICVQIQKGEEYKLFSLQNIGYC